MNTLLLFSTNFSYSILKIDLFKNLYQISKMAAIQSELSKMAIIAIIKLVYTI